MWGPGLFTCCFRGSHHTAWRATWLYISSMTLGFWMLGVALVERNAMRVLALEQGALAESLHKFVQIRFSVLSVSCFQWVLLLGTCIGYSPFLHELNLILAVVDVPLTFVVAILRTLFDTKHKSLLFTLCTGPAIGAPEGVTNEYAMSNTTINMNATDYTGTVQQWCTACQTIDHRWTLAEVVILPNLTAHIWNLSATAFTDKLLSIIHFGPIDNVRVFPEESFAFIPFLDGATAELKIGPGASKGHPAYSSSARASPAAMSVSGLGTSARSRSFVTRTIHPLPSHFRGRKANKTVNTFPTKPAWAGRRVNYSKDRCACVLKSLQVAVQQAQAAAAQLLSRTVAAASPTMASPLTAGSNGFRSPFNALIEPCRCHARKRIFQPYRICCAETTFRNSRPPNHPRHANPLLSLVL
ncbi:hypothetical protein CYLTODRAFT_493122 [Cylindrobasidium torrendii FP15055 ss-10]|uniref:Uncharacterized protein n=1 Tax=Cylindrobasidium torrendii FP15055 ss-10 TaxID=1314674 RepID=A0A0D7B2L8_9AGAR|nr:hypothetical protein CYLTODRAFT_493122 [Cylindrobasidium torrendii FP15055 ss-10]